MQIVNDTYEVQVGQADATASARQQQPTNHLTFGLVLVKLSSMRLLTSVLIKPAGPDCNMACEYCFYRDKSSLFPESQIHRMSDETLKLTTRQFMGQSNSSISVCWQGGEPTLAGLPFFEKAIEYQERFGQHQRVENSLQTNGLLLNGEWIGFLRANRFLVGLSLDGPEHVHDHYRREVGRLKTAVKVMDTAGRMLDSGIAVNVLVVVNDYSSEFAEEIYVFHKSLGLTFMQFVPCLEPHPNDRTKPAPWSVRPEKYGEFLMTLFDLWIADFSNGKPATFVRFFESLLHKYVGLPAPMCTLMKECGNYVVIEHNGEVYSCDFFVQPEWRLGNIQYDSLVEMLNSPRQLRFGELKSNYRDGCLTCPWFEFCQGGCHRDQLFQAEKGAPGMLCPAYKMFFEYAHQRMARLAADWMEKRQNNVETQAHPGSGIMSSEKP